MIDRICRPIIVEIRFRGPIALCTIASCLLIFSACGSGEALLLSKEESPYQPKAGTNEIDRREVERRVVACRKMSAQELARALDDSDYNQRAAAARVYLERAGIPPSTVGVNLVESRYIESAEPNTQAQGFSFLGQLALQGVDPNKVARTVLNFVETHPSDPICDYALWALGETGTDEALEEFYRIAADTNRYGAAARERSFCCISQCGRYSATTRFENIPRILTLAKQVEDPQTQKWCLMALGSMAPGVRASSISDWERWWEKQAELRQRSAKKG